MLEEARQRFDWVILDTPPVSAARRQPAGAMVDGVVLVVEAGSHRLHELVKRAVDAVRPRTHPRRGAESAGRADQASDGYYDDYYHTRRPSEQARP